MTLSASPTSARRPLTVATNDIADQRIELGVCAARARWPARDIVEQRDLSEVLALGQRGQGSPSRVTSISPDAIDVEEVARFALSTTVAPPKPDLDDARRQSLEGRNRERREQRHAGDSARSRSGTLETSSIALRRRCARRATAGRNTPDTTSASGCRSGDQIEPSTDPTATAAATAISKTPNTRPRTCSSTLRWRRVKPETSRSALPTPTRPRHTSAQP